mgnify:FL=1|tara:strand:+ start:3774 stop:4274 length:501 start_codon:yes stop_codon:yes gene_type:complete
MDYFYLHHVLHSLAIAKYLQFKSGSKVMDVGTGGGFPGIPLAILFPDVNFYLVDSIGKKIKVINGIKEELSLDNVHTFNDRMEKLDLAVDFVVCRAVAPMETLVHWVGDKIAEKHLNDKKNGLLCLKGGDLGAELKAYKKAKVVSLNTYFSESFFETKKLVYLPIN